MPISYHSDLPALYPSNRDPEVFRQRLDSHVTANWHALGFHDGGESVFEDQMPEPPATEESSNTSTDTEPWIFVNPLTGDKLNLGSTYLYTSIQSQIYTMLALWSSGAFSGKREPRLNGNRIIGIMANIQAESNFKPSAVNPHSGASGLFQYLGGRLDGLKAFCSRNNATWENRPDLQILYMLTLDEPKTLERFLSDARSGTDHRAAAEWWAVHWERPFTKTTPENKRSSELAKRKGFADTLASNLAMLKSRQPGDWPTSLKGIVLFGIDYSNYARR